MQSTELTSEIIKSSLLVLPRLGHLLFCLAKDARVPLNKKLALASGLFYFVLPTDFVPEGSLPHIGMLDDLIVLLRVFRRVLVDLDQDIILEHWAGTKQELSWLQQMLVRGDDAIMRLWNKVIAKDSQLSGSKG